MFSQTNYQRPSRAGSIYFQFCFISGQFPFELPSIPSRLLNLQKLSFESVQREHKHRGDALKAGLESQSLTCPMTCIQFYGLFYNIQ